MIHNAQDRMLRSERETAPVFICAVCGSRLAVKNGRVVGTPSGEGFRHVGRCPVSVRSATRG